MLLVLTKVYYQFNVLYMCGDADDRMTSDLLIALPMVDAFTPTVSTHVHRKLSPCARGPETGRRTSGSAPLAGSIKLSGTYVPVWSLQGNLLHAQHISPTEDISFLTSTLTYLDVTYGLGDDGSVFAFWQPTNSIWPGAWCIDNDEIL